jgi:hypothetical protein
MVLGFLPLFLFLLLFVIIDPSSGHPFRFTLGQCPTGEALSARALRYEHIFSLLGIGAIPLYVIEAVSALMVLIGNIFFWKRARLTSFVSWLLVALGLDLFGFYWIFLQFVQALRCGSWGF